MNIKVDEDFRIICLQIIKEDKSIETWAEWESDDMFSAGVYSGGFDATEMEFCFSTIINEEEYWFQLPLSDIFKIIQNEVTEIKVRLAEK